MSNARSVAETVTGALVLATALGFLVYAAGSADIGPGGAYELIARFRKADGVTVGGDVRMSGIKIGSVRALELDPQTYEAKITLAIQSDVHLPEDSSAAVASDGLLGGGHIAIQPGGSEFMMEQGGEFLMTQSSVNLLDLVGQAIGGAAGGGQ